jgi:hypothetical protein
MRRHGRHYSTDAQRTADKDRRLLAGASVGRHARNGDLGRKGGSGQRSVIAGGNVDLKLRMRSPSASFPATVREINSCNDVRNPAAWWER